MNHPIDRDPESCKGVHAESCRREDSKHLKLLEALIDKIINRLEDNSCQPKIRDALKAIKLKQELSEVKSVGVVKTSEVERSETHRAEKIFWEEIEAIRRCALPKLYPEPTNLEAQIQAAILSLKDLVKNGILPVKTATGAFNQGRSKQGRLTYHRMGRLLSAMGFTKAKTPNGCSAIIWDDKLLQDESFLKTHPLTHRIPAGRKTEKFKNQLQKGQKRQFRRSNRGAWCPAASGWLDSC